MKRIQGAMLGSFLTFPCWPVLSLRIYHIFYHLWSLCECTLWILSNYLTLYSFCILQINNRIIMLCSQKVVKLSGQLTAKWEIFFFFRFLSSFLPSYLPSFLPPFLYWKCCWNIIYYCCSINCVLQNSYVQVLTPLFQNEITFGDRSL